MQILHQQPGGAPGHDERMSCAIHEPAAVPARVPVLLLTCAISAGR
jgi:hypothetical protein